MFNPTHCIIRQIFAAVLPETMTSNASSSDRPPKRPRIEPRGGHRQRARWADEAPSSVDAGHRGPSHLAEHLLDKWSWGALSTPQIQATAKCVVLDGCSHPDVVTLSKLGSDGKYPNNMYSELCNKLQPTPITHALDEITVWQKKPGKRPVEVTHKILLPHKLFASLYADHNDVFKASLLGGGEDEPARFWEAMQGNPTYHSHPVSTRGTPTTRAIPLALHGDGVTTSGCGKSWARSVDAYSWCSLLSKSNSDIKANFLIYLIFGKLLVQGGNLSAFHAFECKLTWSLYWLFLGRWPTRDEHGKEYPRGSPEWRLAHEQKQLAGGYYGVLWLLTGDLDHMMKAWGLASPTSTTRPCSCCAAKGDDDDKPWTDGRLDVAAWVASIWTNTSWAVAFPDRSHIFKQLPGFGIEQYIPDVMHTLHVGTYQYAFASAIKLLTHHHLPGQAEENVETLWEEIRQAYLDF